MFTQHKPLLKTTLDKLFKGQLKEKDFPFMSLTTKDPPKDVIVFVVGGITYEEALCIAEMNKELKQQGKSIILGGTTVHNSRR